MNLKFPRITSGYAGIFSPNSSVSSQLVFFMLDQPGSFPRFPQRVPRLGFFDEMKKVESDIWLKKFNVLKESISGKIQESANIRQAISYSEVLVRFGGKVSSKIIEDYHDSSYLKYLNTVSTINYELSNNENIDRRKIIHILELSKKVDSFQHKISMLLQSFVTMCRHKVETDDYIFLKDLRSRIVDLSSDLDTRKKEDLILISMVYRGISMLPKMDEKDIEKELRKSLEFANEAYSTKSNDNIISLLAKENIYTLFQTFNRWESTKGRPNNEVNYLDKMIRLDPHDNTAFFEQALMAIEKGNPKKALEHLEKCIEIGPPGLAMAYFYKGIAHKELNETKSAEKAFNISVDIDSSAVSPAYELIELYKELGNPDKARSWARHILSKDALAMQLEESELAMLENYAC